MTFNGGNRRGLGKRSMVWNDKEFIAQLEHWGARFLPEQRLSEYTSLGVGGGADLTVLHRLEALEPVVEGLRERGIAWGLLGGGTNVLAADEPHRKVYLRLARPSRGTEFLDDTG